MIYVLIFFYAGAGVKSFDALVFKSKKDACYFFRTSESTPKSVQSINLKTGKTIEIGWTECEQYDFTNYTPKEHV